MTSTCLVYNIWCLETFNFLESKAIYDRLEPLLAQEVYVASARSSTSSIALDEDEEKEKEEDKCTWL